MPTHAWHRDGTRAGIQETEPVPPCGRDTAFWDGTCQCGRALSEV